MKRAFFVIRKGKWDIPEYYGDGAEFGLDLGYLIMGPPHGPAFTLDQAYAFSQGAHVAFGFPDILFEPGDAMVRAFERLANTHADIVLGLFPAHDPRVMDMVRIDRDGAVRELVIKPGNTQLRLTWIFAVWAPQFTEFLHGQVRAAAPLADIQPTRGAEVELTPGEVLRAGLQRGIAVQSVTFSNQRYLDIGTADGLRSLPRWRESIWGAGTCRARSTRRARPKESARGERSS